MTCTFWLWIKIVLGCNNAYPIDPSYAESDTESTGIWTQLSWNVFRYGFFESVATIFRVFSIILRCVGFWCYYLNYQVTSTPKCQHTLNFIWFFKTTNSVRLAQLWTLSIRPYRWAYAIRSHKFHVMHGGADNVGTFISSVRSVRNKVANLPVGGSFAYLGAQGWFSI